MTMPGTVVSQSTSPVSTNGFLHAVRKPSRPRETQSTDVRPVDLIERTEAMLIEGATDRQPIGRVGLGQHAIGDRSKRGLLFSSGSPLCALAMPAAALSKKPTIAIRCRRLARPRESACTFERLGMDGGTLRTPARPTPPA
jgi:hypothetical protein